MTSSPTVLRRPDRLSDGYVFDLDGTVYLGDALLPGAGEVIASVRARGCRTVFLSNNPTATRRCTPTSSASRRPGGRGEPDAAAVVAAIEACTQVMCEANLGKPGVEMLETVLGMLACPRAAAC